MAIRRDTAPLHSPIPRWLAVVCLPDPAQAEFERIQADLSLRRIRIDQLDTEIAPLNAALDAFEWKYRSRLGPLQHELGTLRNQCEVIEHRTIRIHARLVADPDGVLGDLFTREELNEIGDMFGIDIPASWFAHEGATAEREHERAWRFHESTGRNATEEEEILRRMSRTNRPQLPADQRRELRALYLKLARNCHPDLATDDADRQRRAELMHRINDAWHAQDLHALRSIEEDRGGVLGWRRLTSWAERLRWAQRECARLDEQVLTLTRRLHDLRTNETYPLWFNPSLGDSVMTQRVTSLRIDIATAHHRLDEAKDAFKQALQFYAASVA